MGYVVEMREISKQFPAVLANNRVSLCVESGTIHAIIGENGAGKTTLMNILYGLYQPDGGEILIKGSGYLSAPPWMPFDRELAWCISILC